MRLLHLPNEPPNATSASLQVGAREGFRKLLSTGDISDLKTYSFIDRLASAPTYHAFRSELLHEVESFRPDIIFVQHVTGRKLDRDLWRDVLAKAPTATIAYHDADAYGWIVKKIDRAMKDILAVSHINFTVSLGYVRDAFAQLSAGRVFYSPHCFDEIRFPIRELKKDKAYQIVAIGNEGRLNRASFLFMPGGRSRHRLFRMLSDTYGEDFALYGSGWSGFKSAKGRLPYLEQQDAVRSARISVHWNNFTHLPYYFSDRVPIFLTAGVPFVTSHQPGYDHIFSGCRGFYTGKTVREVAECVHWLLSRPDEHLAEEGRAAQQWVKENLHADIVFGRAFELCRQVHLERQAAR